MRWTIKNFHARWSWRGNSLLCINLGWLINTEDWDQHPVPLWAWTPISIELLCLTIFSIGVEPYGKWDGKIFIWECSLTILGFHMTWDLWKN